MAEIQYILNGQPCNPKNRRSINYVLDFSGRRFREVELSVDALEFVAEDLDAVNQWRATYGDYVGMPLKIQYTNGLTIDYVLDFADESTVFSDRMARVKLLRYQNTDNFFDNAEATSFRIINWAPADFQDIDYVIVRDNNLAVFISLALATFSLAQELAKSIQEIAEGISDLVKATTPVGLPVPAPDFGAIIVAAIKLLARIAYTVFIIIALIKLAQEIIEIVFPKIRQFKGIKLRRLIEKGCQHLGYTLASTMLDSLENAVILPVPLKEKDPSFWKQLFQPLSLAYTNGHPDLRDTMTTFGQALSFLERNLNAEVRIENGTTVRIELESYYEQQASTQLSEAFNVQDKLQDQKTINSSEIFKRLTLIYRVDPSDINTFDDTSKSLYEVSSEVQNSTGQGYELIRRLNDQTLPFARGTRKGSLTFIEEIVKTFAKAIDLFCGTSLAAKIEARADVLQISQQYFGVTKLLWMNGTRLHPNQNDFIGAEALTQAFWSDKFIENNQKDKKPNMPLELTESEFFNIEANNFVNLPDGRTAKITRVSWNDWTCMSEIDLEIKKPAVNETTIVVNAG